MKKILSYSFYWFWSLTWGCIMTTIGLLVAIVLLITKHKPQTFGPNVYFVVGKQWGGVNFGPIFVCSKNSMLHTKCHEAGHGLQNLIWGPLMPFVIAIPSAIRYWYIEYIYRTNIDKYNTLPAYDSIWFEGQATRWGEKTFYNLYK